MEHQCEHCGECWSKCECPEYADLVIHIKALEAKNKELLEMIVGAKDRINMDTPIKDELWWYEKLGKLLADKEES